MLGILDEIIVSTFAVILGLGIYAVVSNRIHAAQPTVRIAGRKSDDETINRTASMVQELYDEFIVNKKEGA